MLSRRLQQPVSKGLAPLMRAGGLIQLQQRNRIGGPPVFMQFPPPPPKEYLADGTPKTYPLHQPVFDHGYTWEHWYMTNAGVFHTVYYGEFAKDFPWRWGFLAEKPFWVGAPIVVLGVLCLGHIIQTMGQIGVKPKRYTPEWVEATKERERAENTNPVTRYLDRRRAERGPYYLMSNVLPYHPHFLREKDRELAAQLEAEGKLDMTRAATLHSHTATHTIRATEHAAVMHEKALKALHGTADWDLLELIKHATFLHALSRHLVLHTAHNPDLSPSAVVVENLAARAEASARAAAYRWHMPFSDTPPYLPILKA
ncbi:hypothetical protein FOZ60_002294 [Perkinsus olseni]|uniref:Uncharacterized protein n=1 Tax=Perkinsus olseni TaxID=32597 RepID=A0A7J6PIQ1_PEROL|nr:hypothetical protein FOZ60_002294 [Perkinsus olseni]